MNALVLVTVLLGILICYVYVGYPVLTLIVARFFPDRSANAETMSEPPPAVTMMISCFNEEAVLPDKIANCLAIDYPPELIKFCFVSDASSDRTDAIVQETTDPRVMLVRQQQRLGKTSGLNLAVAQTESELIVFSDANAMYQPDAVRELVTHFSDPEVGYVVGAALYKDVQSSAAAASEDIYWKYELALKKAESRIHSVVGGDGAIYAIRRSLFTPLDVEDINDFVNPLQIVHAGYRGVFTDRAVAIEEAAGTFAKEARRKERIVNRSLRGLLKTGGVMNPLRTGTFSPMVISHKLLRWLLPFFIVLFCAGCLALGFAGYAFFAFIALGIIAFAWFTFLGYACAHRRGFPNILALPYYFSLVNWFTARGVITSLRGNIQVTWSTPRAQDAGEQGLGRALWIALILLLITLPAGVDFAVTLLAGVRA